MHRATFWTANVQTSRARFLPHQKCFCGVSPELSLTSQGLLSYNVVQRVASEW